MLVKVFNDQVRHFLFQVRAAAPTDKTASNVIIDRYRNQLIAVAVALKNLSAVAIQARPEKKGWP